jgi:hypothetical protein
MGSTQWTSQSPGGHARHQQLLLRCRQPTAGYHQRFVEDCCITLGDGKVVRLRQAPSAKQFKQQQQQQQQRQQGGNKNKGQRQGHDPDKQSDPALTGST